MKRILDSAKAFLGSRAGRVSAAAGVVVASVGAASVAGATGDAVTSGFTTIQTSLVGYLGDGVVLVLAVMALGLGIRMLIKWARRAVSAT